MSAARGLVLDRIAIRRTPGIPDGFVVDGLCGGVNLIHGPNASGKTSTARAIQAALWPNSDARTGLGLSAGYTLDGARYLVELDGKFAAVQKDGRDASPPELPVPALRHRYFLSLHDLVQSADERDVFAEHIARESAGGFDLEAAAAQAGCREKPSGTGAEARTHRTALDTLKAAQARQASLHEEGRALAALEARRAEAAPAAARAGTIGKAIRHAEALAHRDAAAASLAAFPPEMAGVRGDELARLADLEGRAAHSSRQRQAAEEQMDAELGAARALFPNGAPADTVVEALRSGGLRLSSLAQARDEAGRRDADTAAQLDAAQLALGAAVTDEELARVDAATIPDLGALAREAEAVHAEEAAVAAALPDAADTSDLPTARAVHRALLALQGWLREEVRQAGAAGAARRTWAWAAVVLAAIGWALLGVLVNPIAFVGVAVSVLLGFLLARGSSGSPDGRAAAQAEYRAAALAPPASWSPEAVVRRLDELYATLESVKRGELEAERVRVARVRGAEAAARRERLDRRAAEITERLGVPGGRDPRELNWLVERIARWQDARRAREGAHAALEAASAGLASAIREIADALAPFGIAAGTGTDGAAAAVATLVDRVHRHGATGERAMSARARLADAQSTLAMIDDERRALFASVGASCGDADALASLCARYGEYATCAEGVRAAEAECRRTHAELTADVGFEPALLTMSVPSLDAERQRASALAEEHASLIEQASVLRSRIEEAKRGRDVEEALDAVATAEAALRDVQGRDLRAMVGDALLRYARDATRDAHRPAVFRRSRELLALITAGRLQLDFDEDAADVAAFRAIDTTTGQGMALDELSSGSRLQLLLAVRVAFVEAQEHGVKLPLLLDETLATSDDCRAQAIIDAVIALAEDGRQVFYFTAQSDEVARWAAALAKRAAPFTVIDLGAVRGLGPANVDAPPVTARAADWRLTMPTVDGHTHESFGAALRVPAIRVGEDHVGAAHVWYLVDDLGALGELIGLGVTAWGALEALHDGGGGRLLARYPRAYARAAALAAALAALHEGGAVGRGRTIDREAITGCSAVSAVKREEVVALAERCGGDPARLLSELRDGAIAGFQRRKVDELEAQLLATGHLDPSAPATAAELRVGMIAACADALTAGTITADDIDALLHRLEARADASRSVPAPVAMGTEPSNGAVAGRYLSA